MSVSVHQVDTHELMDLAGPFLPQREDEHNLLLGLLSSMPSYLAVVMRDGEVLGAALASSRGLVLSRVADPDVVDAVVEDLTALGIPLPGVIGPPAARRQPPVRRAVDGPTRRKPPALGDAGAPGGSWLHGGCASSGSALPSRVGG
ncbi:MAG: hypothetical protein ACRD0K_26490, partial [Egibacteraceae bacterium]